MAAPELTSPAIDQVLGELERVVAELEAGDLPLESALKRFEDGVRLARQGGQLLDAVEQRVEMLLEGRDGTAPFPGTNEDDDDGGDDDDSV
ncbi:exodeoxyribonuclease VII small subunit [Nannocystis sp.]|uniref:exodeoxyribonuclease VII small subunit n=1 Tax=Nannocystis sp. TaxID=1962667 RepID=UPI0024211C70|nr:exodeoxyribonuclease VII small subunit [Nannocystis sp.]MBK7824590.1 exodeoxyribonuclease VII small subunit [Nannocystis sp.]MBK9753158.1 exodeoxyribonuclease VII small subunit [Nannocystis sp.]